MKRNFRIKRGGIRLMSSYSFSKVINNLLLMTFIPMLVYFAGCSDEISTINSNQSLTNTVGEAARMKAAVQPHTLMFWGDGALFKIGLTQGWRQNGENDLAFN